ncbi:MAG: DUF3307 domain-containing protein [Rhizobiales bacterium]|nr:DUF3307 domain-containing protein [Hyphomicrobiales bacterium]MBN9010466.1 DUF3307 domain-containing protein [Hyphomicrobiales bacterium]
MTDPFAGLLVVMIVLQIKHFICDYPLQTAYQLRNKGTYGHPGGIIHALIHMAGTSVSFLVVQPTLVLGAGLLVAEGLVHYNVDWTKEQLNRRLGYTAANNGFWWAIGADQLIHHLTYSAIGGTLVYQMLVL